MILAGNLNFKLRIVFWNIFFWDLEIWKTNRTFWKKATFSIGINKRAFSILYIRYLLMSILSLDSKSNPVMQLQTLSTVIAVVCQLAFVLLYSTAYNICMCSNLETRVYHRVPCMYGGGTTCWRHFWMHTYIVHTYIVHT